MKALLWSPLFVAALLAWPPAAAADPGAELSIRIERDTRPRTTGSDLAVYYIVTLTDQATGGPPATKYNLFGIATSSTGRRTPSFECEHARDNAPEVAPGVYYCPLYVDHGGSWEFEVFVNRPRVNPDEPPTTIARSAVPLEVTTDQAFTGTTRPPVKGRAFEVLVLQTHSVGAGLWIACLGALLLVVHPSGRRSLSPGAIYRLEHHGDLLLKLMALATGVVIGTAAYLLLEQAAYETPFSSREVEGVFTLPYGKPYFLTLAVKALVYIVLLAATVPLVLQARRQIQGPRASTMIRIVTVVAAVGVPVVLLCVTLLKYFHELIEASRLG